MGQFNFKDAHLLFKDLAEQFPENNDLRVNMAIALLNRQLKGDEEEALGILQTVLDREPQNLRARYCRALLLLHKGKLKPALNNFITVLLEKPKDADLLYFTGKTLMQLSMYNEALEYFYKSAKQDPYLVSCYYSSIITLRQLGRENEAQQMIEAYKDMKNNPRSRTASFKYSKMGRLAEVIALDTEEEKALTLPPGELFEKPKTIFSVPDFRTSVTGNQKNPEITVAQIDGDGHLDIFIPAASEQSSNSLLWGNADSSSFVSAKDHPFSNIQGINSALWGDINDDGLTDVYFLCRGSNRLFLQSSGNTWVEATESSGTSGRPLNSVAGALFDADHDGDLDIYIVNLDGPNELFNNNRNGSFKPLAIERNIAGESDSTSILVQDLDKDRDADIIVINKTPPHHVYINDRLWNYTESKDYSHFTSQDIVSLSAGDTDADGELEIYTLNRNGQLIKWEHKNGTLASEQLFDLKIPLNWQSSRVQLVDCNGDGNLEILISYNNVFSVFSLNEGRLKELFYQALPSGLLSASVVQTKQGPSLIFQCKSGKIKLLQAGPGRFKFALVQVTGRKEKEANLRSNSSGIGTSLLVRVNSRWTALDTYHNDLNRGQSSQPLAIGLGSSKMIDFIQIDWPDGVFQTELAIFPDTLNIIAETQRQMSSCPVLFAWNGNKFEFVSDLLGVGGIGYAIGPGEYADSRPWEHFLLPEGAIRPKDDRLQLIMTEPMEEVEYLDSVEMSAYDLPPSWSMTMDERMGILGPQPTGKPIFYRKRMRPVRAVNERGEDVTASILENDLTAAPVGQLDRRFIGKLKEHHILTLTFSEPLNSTIADPVLVADGWVEYPYSQTSFAAWQAGEHYAAPTVEVRMQDGSWRLLLDQFGYPAGMPRQMAVPLENMPKGVKEIRISTNQEVYWDKLFIAFPEPCPAAVKQTLPLVKAVLEDIGFPQRTDFPQRRPYYDYSKRNTTWDSRLLEGYYSELGDVLELVGRRDQALAILGPGEGIHLEFIIPAMEPPSKGWKRHYVLSSYGWCKDMDLYTNTGETVAPLPVSPELEKAEELHKKYNTRFLVGRK